MPHYYADVDPVLRNTSHTLVMEMIGTDKDVLDVGCASGYLAKALKERGNRVSGIEYMPEEAEVARPFLEKLVIADLTAISLVDEFGEGLFDAIVFADVLEHLPDPLETVRGAVPLLKPGGSIIISIPNVAHGAVRLGLLQGSWNYTYTGLLDATHLRFFTRKTLETMLSDAGLTVEELRGTVADPLQCEVQIDDDTLPAGIVQWVREQPYAMTYQFVVRAVVGDPSTPWPELVPSIEIPVVDDVHRQRSLERPEVPADALAERDLLRAETTTLHRENVRLRDQAKNAIEALGAVQDELSVTRTRADQASAELAGFTESWSWKVGRTLVRPAAWVYHRVLHR